MKIKLRICVYMQVDLSEFILFVKTDLFDVVKLDYAFQNQLFKQKGYDLNSGDLEFALFDR